MKKLVWLVLSVAQIFGPLNATENLMQSEIEHVVILMLENRSFDNVLGWLYDQDAPQHFIPHTTNPEYLGLTEETLNLYVNTLKNSKGEVVYSSPPIKGLPSVAKSNLINSPKFDPNEPFENVTAQIFNGESLPTMTGFLQDYASLWKESSWIEQKEDICGIMEGYTKNELPLVHGLAKHYAVSDYYFSSVPTQTNPNRAFSLCGTSEGQINNGFLGKNLVYSDTLWNRLEEESPETTWTVFWQSDFIPVIYKGPLTGTNLFASMGRIPNLEKHFMRFNKFHELARKGTLPNISYLEPQWTLSVNVTPKEKSIFDEIFKDEDLILGFEGNDAHPPGDVRTAENLIANIYTSLTANTDAWNKTLFIIVFDEHGGLFDHIVPPASIAPDSQNQNGFNFDRYGVRVPIIFISPRIAEKTVVRAENPTIPFDHTSFIATLLKWKNIDQSKWKMGKRVDNAPTFESVITLKQPRSDTIIPYLNEKPVYDHQNDAIQMGEKFYIRDSMGNYIVKSPELFKYFAQLGPIENRVAFSFEGGEGNLTVGSFALLKSSDQSLNDKNLLQTALTSCDCVFSENTEDPEQWWIIKRFDTSCTGADVHYNDPVYFENHSYFNLTQYIPVRLAIDIGVLGKYIKTVPITQERAENDYWFLEKAN